MSYSYIDLFFFFFQAEDGIRDLTVTGVQTCALPISLRRGGSNSRSTTASTRRAARKRSFPRWWRAGREAQATAPALLGVRGRAVARSPAARPLPSLESRLRRDQALRLRRHDRPRSRPA